jgi:hypothetical protein
MRISAESSAVLAWLLGEDSASRVREVLLAAELVISSDLTLIECDRVLNRPLLSTKSTRAQRLTVEHI